MTWSRSETYRETLLNVGFQMSGISPRAPRRMIAALACVVDCRLTAVLDTEDWLRWYAIRPGRRLARDTVVAVPLVVRSSRQGV